MCCQKSVTLKTWRREVAKYVALPPASELASQSDNSKLDCTGLKVDPFRNCWAYKAVFGLILNWKSHAIPQQEDILNFIDRIFVNLCEKVEKLPKLRIFYNYIWLQFSTKLIRNLKKILLRGEATLSLWFEPKHNYVGPAVTKWIYMPVGLCRACFSAVGLFLSQKSKIFHEQIVKKFQFYIRLPNFSFLGSIIKKVPKGSRYPLASSKIGCWISPIMT